LSWISNWFGKFSISALEKSCKALLDMLKPFLAPALKQSITELWELTKENVESADASGKEGDEKFEMVYKQLVKDLGAVGKVFISVAIELAVALLRTKLKQS